MCPFLLDQFYWAARLEYIGVAAPALKPQDLMPGDGTGEVDCGVKNVGCALRKALGSDMRKRAKELALEVSKEVGMKNKNKENVACHESMQTKK